MNVTMKKISWASLLAATVLMATPSAHAATIVVEVDTADRQITRANTGGTLTLENIVGPNARSGRNGTASTAQYVMPFLLPTLNPAEIDSVNLAIVSNGVNTPGNNHQIRIIGLRATADVLTTDYALDAAAPSGGTLVQNNFAPAGVASATGQVYETDATGDANLKAWLQANYVAGQYLMLRVNPIVTATGSFIDTTTRMDWATFDHATLAAPTLTIVIPEPASLALLAAGSLLLVSRRR